MGPLSFDQTAAGLRLEHHLTQEPLGETKLLNACSRVWHLHDRVAVYGLIWPYMVHVALYGLIWPCKSEHASLRLTLPLSYTTPYTLYHALYLALSSHCAYSYLTLAPDRRFRRRLPVPAARIPVLARQNQQRRLPR